jgi:hypothetical protein
MIEQKIEQNFINTLVGLKYEYRADITDRATLQAFVGSILDRMIVDGEQLGALMEPLEFGWKARPQDDAGLAPSFHTN